MDTAPNSFLELAARGKTAWWRYPVVVILASLIVFVLVFSISLVLSAAHLIDTRTLASLQHATSGPAFFVFAGATFGLILFGFVASIALVQGKSIFDITGPWRSSLFLAGFGIWVVVEIVGTLLDYLIAPHGFSLSASRATLNLAAFVVVGLAIQTFAEEFIFRGYFTQGILLLVKRPILASVLSGLLFGLPHISNGWPQAVNACFFGIACAYIAIRTGGIAFTYGVHLANNLFGAIVLVSADDVFKGSPGLFTQNTPHLMWWDTAVLAVALAGLAILVARSRRLTNA